MVDALQPPPQKIELSFWDAAVISWIGRARTAGASEAEPEHCPYKTDHPRDVERGFPHRSLRYMGIEHVMLPVTESPTEQSSWNNQIHQQGVRFYFAIL